MTEPSMRPHRPAIQLYAYQRAWLLDQARFKIGMFARQTGKTFTTTIEVVDDAFKAELEGRRARWVILSRGERQAKEAMDEGVKRHARAYSIGLETFDYDYVPDGGVVSYKALEVALPGGSRITALPANPDTARGFSSNVFLDEFAFHRDSRAIWTALFPVISAGWKMRITSTPNGKGNKFYELMSGDDATWSRHIVDIHRAVRDGLPRDVAQLRAAIGDDDAWAQEFELQWLDDASAWLSYDTISACESESAGDPDGYAGGMCFVGVDIARRRDLFVIVVLELVGDVLVERERVELLRAAFAQQDEALDAVMQRYRVVRVAMDQTGMGEKPTEDAQRRYGLHRVEGVIMSAPRQLDIATHLKAAFEDRKIRIPMGQPQLRADLHKPKKVVGLTGHPRIVADRDGEGHADRFWAYALAAGAAAGPAVEYGYTSLPRGGASRGHNGGPPLDDDDDRPGSRWHGTVGAAAFPRSRSAW